MYRALTVERFFQRILSQIVFGGLIAMSILPPHRLVADICLVVQSCSYVFLVYSICLNGGGGSGRKRKEALEKIKAFSLQPAGGAV